MGILLKRPLAMILAVLLALTLTACEAAPGETEPTKATEPQVLTAVRYMDTLPANWSIASAQTPEKEYLRRMTTTALYSVADGAVAPGFAALPEDVTAEYLGTYGIPVDAERGYAFQIRLDGGVFWEDGAAVTAGDVLFALETMLEDYLWIAGAEEFAALWERESENVISLEEAGFDSVEAARAAGYNRFYVDMAQFWGLESGWGSTEGRSRVQDYAMPAGLSEMYVTSGYLYAAYLADGMSYDHLQAEFVGVSAEPENRMTMEDVGILVNGENELVIIARQPMTVQTVALELSRLCLLRQELYGESYGTSAESYSSCGPYRIVSASAEEIVLERNVYWQRETVDYPADRIECRPR